MQAGNLELPEREVFLLDQSHVDGKVEYCPDVPEPYPYGVFRLALLPLPYFLSQLQSISEKGISKCLLNLMRKL